MVWPAVGNFTQSLFAQGLTGGFSEFLDEFLANAAVFAHSLPISCLVGTSAKQLTVI